MVRIAVVGSRKVKNYGFVKRCFLEVLKKEGLSPENVMLVSGGAEGVDALAQRLAKEMGLPILIFYPDWLKYGRKAGLMRNSRIVANSDIVVAVPHKTSRGTFDTIRKARTEGKKLYVFEYGEGNEPGNEHSG
jgi:predicted Rossmann fold nucleotide-binding protein DprA/Smf involved in DNA uptake